jgi:hypothetical protein
MKKFYYHSRFVNEDTGLEHIVLKWWESSIPGVPDDGINDSFESLTQEQLDIYNEYIANPVIYDMQDRILDDANFPPSEETPA